MADDTGAIGATSEYDGSLPAGAETTQTKSYMEYLEALRKKAGVVPKPVDQLGQRIYGSSQFAGGNDPNVRRSYPNIGEVAGGYFKSNDDVSDKLGYGPDAGVWLASGGGIMGKDTKARMNNYQQTMGQINASANTETAKKYGTTVDKVKQLLQLFKSQNQMA